MNLREYRSEDCPRLMELFWDSVHGAVSYTHLDVYKRQV